MRPTRAEIDLGAIRHNVGVLRALVAPAELLVVVKADGYGHGAVPVARAAVAAGASTLGVALVEEGIELRDAGIAAAVLVLSEPHPSSMPALVDASLASVVYTAEGIAALGKAAESAGSIVDVHLKVDTGMRRVGADPADAVALAQMVAGEPSLRLAAAMTHLAVADEPDRPETAQQLARFAEVVAGLRAAGIDPPSLHAANSAGAIDHPAARLDLVRCGIAVYGIAPGPGVVTEVDLRPAMRLVSEVSFVKQVPAGEGVSYGLAYTTPQATTLATVPVGYADGVPRPLGTAGGEVLIGGRRLPIAGNVTMDQLVVDCGPGAAVEPGAEVVLLGAQGDEWVTAEEWADLLGTIGYEIVTRAGPRVPRTYLEP